MAEGSESKTEKASPKKRRDERKKGNVFQSKDVTTVFSLLLMFITLQLVFPFIYKYMSSFVVRIFSRIATVNEMSVSLTMDILRESIVAFIFVAGLLLLASIVVTIIVSGTQTKFLVSFESMKFKMSNMSILKGIKRMFSLRSVVELLKSIIKVTIIITIVLLDFQDIFSDILDLMSVDLMSSVVFILSSIMDLVFKIIIAFAAVSLFDYLYQWWDYEKKLKMSKQDQKEEYKHMEGDPLVKGKIKERQRKMAQQRMMQSVPTADVVIRNPTHFAVALRYDVEKDQAPIVVAKGKDLVAFRIIEIAEKNGILTTEDPPLAQALYKYCEVNTQVSEQFFVAIAEIMAWVYSMRKEKL